MKQLKKAIRSGFRSLGFDVQRIQAQSRLPVEFTEVEREAFDYVRRHELSMVSDERLFATILACKHVVDQGIAGDFVECGVFRGGNAIIAKMMFDRYRSDRRVWLFDTFRGMTEPDTVDVESATGRQTIDKHRELERGTHNEWVFCPIDAVKANFANAGLLDDRVKFIEGDVAETLRAADLPTTISVLRLDTDWYESTRIELEVLYPRLVDGGVLIVDDYGCFRGAQQAVDEYFSGSANRPLMNYSDYTGRIGIKTPLAS